MKKKPKIGDVIEIPLPNGRKAYGQYAFWDEKMGPLLQIFDLISKDNLELADINDAKPLFPPIITGLFAAIRTGMWRVIGNLPISKFKYPGFVSTLYNQKTGEASTWFLWDGNESIRLGRRLPDKYKKKEYLTVWSPYDVAERIETGEYPYPYGDLIKYNKYKPKNPKN